MTEEWENQIFFNCAEQCEEEAAEDNSGIVAKTSTLGGQVAFGEKLLLWISFIQSIIQIERLASFS